VAGTHHRNEYPMYGCQIGTKHPIVHVKKDQAPPVHFSGDPFAAMTHTLRPARSLVTKTGQRQDPLCGCQRGPNILLFILNRTVHILFRSTGGHRMHGRRRADVSFRKPLPHKSNISVHLCHPPQKAVRHAHSAAPLCLCLSPTTNAALSAISDDGGSCPVSHLKRSGFSWSRTSASAAIIGSSMAAKLSCKACKAHRHKAGLGVCSLRV
jgi:hypothetical protein